MTLSDIRTFLPFIAPLTVAILLLVIDLWVPAKCKYITVMIAAGGLLLSLGLNLEVGSRILNSGQSLTAFNSMVVVDGFSVVFSVIFQISGLGALVLAYDYLKRMKIERGEYYSLLLFSVCGMLLMSSANDLIIVFLALELLSLPLYILAGFARPRLDSEESALKYFLLGAFATGFVLYGVALIFGATAHTDMTSIVAAVKQGTSINISLFTAGAALLLVGFGFKVAVVPFHMWAPDVYQGAPTPVSGFMSIGAKAAGFAALMRIFVLLFPTIAGILAPVLFVLSALTMIVGNLVAVAQTNIKRLLAYSSIANAGYLLMALVSYGQAKLLTDALGGMLFFLGAYAFTSLGAWAVVIALEQTEGKGLTLDDYAGLGLKYPLLAIPMTVFMLSFTGIPLTLGFWGKLFLFRSAVQGGYSILALIGLLASLFSAYYYLRVVVIMFMRSGEPVVRREFWLTATAILMALLVVGLAFAPNVLLSLACAAGIQ
jgi:NADH-quinone oxidoreductase subunit N